MSRFRQVPTTVQFPKLEQQVLARWMAEKTFEKSIEIRKGAQDYVFYDGPPFATGLPHYGHILTSYIKDVVPRYFTMRGYHVPRRWGWDCHGLPVEFEVEKDLGFRSRAEIVAYGVDRFNTACRTMVRKYTKEWRGIIERLGRWVDFDNDYETMDPDYMESVLWCFRQLHDKGLVYEGDKVVPYCFRCQTPLSNFEARLDDAFRPRQDPAATVAFKLIDAPDQVIWAWTTTPWTLPSNVALAVGPEVDYARFEKDGQSVWLGVAAVPRYAKELAGYEERERVKGSALANRAYEPLFPYFADTANAFRVLTAEFVTTEDGTGVVHLAPAFGEDDNAVCTAAKIQGPNPVRDDGTFDGRVTDFAGQTVFDANGPIAQNLKARGQLVRRDTYEHGYPHCWRCDTPLIYRAIRTWFVKVTEIKARMIANNQSIHWVPEHIRDGRFGNWLENSRDWAVSRNRFWGAPVPVWRCNGCAKITVIGSREELTKHSGREVTDLHRPAVDEHTWKCDACDGTMQRVSDVLDCWFESGAMPYGQVHYPFERKAEFEASYPGDFIVEYVAQTRGWFYTMVVLAAGLFDQPPFRHAVCHGVILAADGRKMSKRLKNYPDPMEIVEEHGSDALRIALLSSAVVSGSDVRFSAESVRDAARRMCIPLWNVAHLFTAFARIDGFEPTGVVSARTPLDKYLLSETETLRADLERLMDAYDFPTMYARLDEHITMLSTWYVRLVRSQLSTGVLDDDKRATFEVFYASLVHFVKMLAPFAPYLAESLFEALGGEGSVHLQDWPEAHPEWKNDAVAADMRALRTGVRLARNIRETHKLRHRHPLRSAAISGIAQRVIDENLELLLGELNVKTVRAIQTPMDYVTPQVKLNFARLGAKMRDQIKSVQSAVNAGRYEVGSDGRLRTEGVELEPEDFTFRYVPKDASMGVAAEGTAVVLLDLTADEALVSEGMMRDLNRELQNLRKRAGLAYADRVKVSVTGPADVWRVVEEHRALLQERVQADAIEPAAITEPLIADEVEVGGHTVRLAIAR